MASWKNCCREPNMDGVVPVIGTPDQGTERVRGASAPSAVLSTHCGESSINMTLSILLTLPWDVRLDAMPRSLDVPKVAPHRFSWKRAGMVGHPRGPWQVFPQRPDMSDDGTSDEAEVIVPGTDEEQFASLHGVLARDADYDAVAARIGGNAGYAGIVEALRAIGAQHPDAMWLVHAWWVDGAAE
jgi:hypothetical protein